MAQVNLPDLVIPAGEKKSNALRLGAIERLRSLGVYAPQDLSGNAIFEAAPEVVDVVQESDYREVVVDGNVPQIKAGQVVTLSIMPFITVRLSLSESSNSEARFPATGWQRRGRD